MPCQSLMTKPLKPSCFFSTPVIMSPRACILMGAVSLPTICRLEYDGMTDPTPCFCTACWNGSRNSACSWACVTVVTPWSTVYEPVVDEPYEVPPSPRKCLAVARTLVFFDSAPLPCRPSMMVCSWSTSAGSSPKDSYERPQRSSLVTQTQGENAHVTPVARVSVAVICPSFLTLTGSRVAPRPMFCGKTVAPTRLLSPCTESSP